MAIKFHISYRVYNGGGGFFEGAVVASLLETQQKTFGAALEEVEVYLCLLRRDPSDHAGVKRSLRKMHDEFHEGFCGKLPRRRFVRKKKRLEITAVATFAVAQEMRKTPKEKAAPFQSGQRIWIESIFNQLIIELEACRAKFNKNDDFEFDEFLKWVKLTRKKIPKTRKAAEAVCEKSREQLLARRAQMTDWELLGIDWDDFHPDARKLVDDPRLWETMNDFSPNGNDTGADVLETVREHKTSLENTEKSNRDFCKSMLHNMEALSIQETDDSVESTIHRQVVIGLAFGYLKVLGFCPDFLLGFAQNEIVNHQKFLENNHLDWEYRAECLEYLTLMQLCLERYSGADIPLEIGLSGKEKTEDKEISIQTQSKKFGRFKKIISKLW